MLAIVQRVNQRMPNVEKFTVMGSHSGEMMQSSRERRSGPVNDGKSVDFWVIIAASNRAQSSTAFLSLNR